MKRVEFGYATEENPRGSWEGLGINPGLFLSEADYYGIVRCNSNYYLVAKVTEDEFEKYPQLLDKFIVRQALCDIYADGSAVLMLNQAETEVTRNLEDHLNSAQIKDKITNINDVIDLSSGLGRAATSFILCELGEKIVSTSITPEAFERKNEAIKGCHSSISEMQQELTQSYTR